MELILSIHRQVVNLHAIRTKENNDRYFERDFAICKGAELAIMENNNTTGLAFSFGLWSLYYQFMNVIIIWLAKILENITCGYSLHL